MSTAFLNSRGLRAVDKQPPGSIKDGSQYRSPAGGYIMNATSFEKAPIPADVPDTLGVTPPRPEDQNTQTAVAGGIGYNEGEASMMRRRAGKERSASRVLFG